MAIKYKLNNYNNTFDVKGSFYCLDIPNLRRVKCRNLLEISRKEYKGGVDAIFIMMNPGSSKPLEKLNKEICYNWDEFILNRGHSLTNLVKTLPDKVHLYTMEIMDIKRWNKVQIVNLSDIRESSSKNFKKEYRKVIKCINDESLKSITSIFNSYRNEKNILSNPNIKIISCWGMNNPKYITKVAVDFLKNKKITPIGIKSKNDGYAYLKPIGREDRILDLIKLL